MVPVANLMGDAQEARELLVIVPEFFQHLLGSDVFPVAVLQAMFEAECKGIRKRTRRLSLNLLNRTLV